MRGETGGNLQGETKGCVTKPLVGASAEAYYKASESSYCVPAALTKPLVGASAEASELSDAPECYQHPEFRFVFLFSTRSMNDVTR
jgi:hypothetical protein